jgi:hypothetical protein
MRGEAPLGRIATFWAICAAGEAIEGISAEFAEQISLGWQIWSNTRHPPYGTLPSRFVTIVQAELRTACC